MDDQIFKAVDISSNPKMIYCPTPVKSPTKTENYASPVKIVIDKEKLNLSSPCKASQENIVYGKPSDTHL